MNRNLNTLIFRGKIYHSFKECYTDNQDIARVSFPTFIKRFREGRSIEEALTSPKGRTLVTRLGSHFVEGVEYENLPSIARAYGLSESRIYRRYQRGMRGTELVPPKFRKDYVPPPPKPKLKQSRQIEVGGVPYRSAREACRNLGVNITTYANRRSKGYTVEQSLGLEPIPKRSPRKGKIYEVQGEKYSLTEISQKFKIKMMTFLRRLDSGMSPEEAATRALKK